MDNKARAEKIVNSIVIHSYSNGNGRTIQRVDIDKEAIISQLDEACAEENAKLKAERGELVREVEDYRLLLINQIDEGYSDAFNNALGRTNSLLRKLNTEGTK